MEIQYFNRHSDLIETEKVYGEGAIRWLYDSKGGRCLTRALVKAPVSVVYGMLQSLPISRHKIAPFINDFQINMDEFLPEEGQDEYSPYSSFNSFFIRKFKNGQRNFVQEKGQLAAFAEGRYFGFDRILEGQTIPVKGRDLSAQALLKDEKWNGIFKDGPLLISRLCPVDYHRFHFPDNGKVIDYYRIDGTYHSVNPLALDKKSSIFCDNIREISILETENFGLLAYIEVGAMMVGRIVQSSSMTHFSKGDEKGYFLFGGSTVIVLGEKGRWRPSADVLLNTSKGLETYIQLGSEVGVKI